MSDVKKVLSHSGSPTTYVLKNDGSIWATGYTGYGQLGVGTNDRSTTFKKIHMDDNLFFKDISVFGADSGTQLLAVDDNNDLWGCGYNGQFSLGMGEDRYNHVTVLTKLRT